MIGSSAIELVLGSRGAGNKENLIAYVRELARAGLAVVLVEPDGKKPLDMRSPVAKREDDKAAQELAKIEGNPRWTDVRHRAGVHLATTDVTRLDRYMKAAEKRYGADAVNLGVEVGRSRLVIVDADTADAVEAFTAAGRAAGDDVGMPTVSTPGKCGPAGEWVHKDGGHWWFIVPDGLEVTTVTEDGWTAYAGDRQVLIPPSTRAEGSYMWNGGVRELPDWLAERCTPVVNAERQTHVSSGDVSPIDAWSAATPWEDILEPAGWSATGRPSNCGCMEWTAPGPHDSSKSATAHDLGCSEYDTTVGHAPVHVWTGNPPEGLRGGGTYSKLQFVAATAHGGDVGAAASALGIPASTADASPDDMVLEGAAPASSWSRIDLGVYARGQFEPVVPTIFARTDGRCLLYPGLTHSFHGESESGKSLILQWVAVQEIKAGRHVLFLDYESDPRSITDRLTAMGATADDIETYFDYRLPETAPDSSVTDQQQWVQMLFPGRYSLVVIDGVTASIGTFGASSQSNDEVNAWTRKLPRALATSTGAAIAMVDHVTKDPGTRGRFAIGAQAKMADVTGAAYTVTPREPVGKGRVGVIRLRVGKDRPSGVRPFCSDYRTSDHTHLVGDITVDSTGPVLTMTLVAGQEGPEAVSDGSGGVRRPDLMEKVSRIVEAGLEEPEPVTEWSARAIQERIKGRGTTIRAAIKVLVAEGYLENTPVGNRMTFTRRYRAADDDTMRTPLPAGDPFALEADA